MIDFEFIIKCNTAKILIKCFVPTSDWLRRRSDAIRNENVSNKYTFSFDKDLQEVIDEIKCLKFFATAI